MSQGNGPPNNRGPGGTHPVFGNIDPSCPESDCDGTLTMGGDFEDVEPEDVVTYLLGEQDVVKHLHVACGECDFQMTKTVTLRDPSVRNT